MKLSGSTIKEPRSSGRHHAHISMQNAKAKEAKRVKDGPAPHRSDLEARVTEVVDVSVVGHQGVALRRSEERDVTSSASVGQGRLRASEERREAVATTARETLRSPKCRSSP